MYDLGMIRAKKRLGQVFLSNPAIAEAEAAHAIDKVVLELGPGPGILTAALCKNAKRVIAVEKDSLMCTLLKHNVKSSKLKLINKDFFKAAEEELELGSVDIMISNVPYNLSSKVIEWLGRHGMQAVLCLQKEFVDHMLAKPDTKDYSKLSVMASLMFRTTKIMNVPKGNFRPIPKVDSAIIYVKPKGVRMAERDMFLIGLIMQHKKKTVYNAILDSDSAIGVDRKKLAGMCNGIIHRDDRVFKLPPEEILAIAVQLGSLLE